MNKTNVVMLACVGVAAVALVIAARPDPSASPLTAPAASKPDTANAMAATSPEAPEVPASAPDGSCLSAIDQSTHDLVFACNTQTFIDRYDYSLNQSLSKKNQNHAKLYQCKNFADHTDCKYRPEAFYTMNVEFRKLGLLHGHVNDASMVEFDRSTAGNVTSVTLRGSRADPINLLTFAGNVEDFAGIWDRSEASKDNQKMFTNDLGLMRGDDAPDIGETLTVNRPYAKISCTSWPSETTMGIKCVFEPRL